MTIPNSIFRRHRTRISERIQISERQILQGHDQWLLRTPIACDACSRPLRADADYPALTLPLFGQSRLRMGTVITPKVFLRVQEEQGAFTVRFLMRI